MHLATTSSHMSSQQGNTYGNGGYGGNPGQSFMAPQRQEMSYLCAGERVVCSEICSWRCSSRTFSTWRLRRVERDPASRAHPLQAVRSSHHVQEKDNQECVPSFPSHLLFDAEERCSGTVRGAVTSRAVALRFAVYFLLRPRALGISRILSSYLINGTVPHTLRCRLLSHWHSSPRHAEYDGCYSTPFSRSVYISTLHM